MEMPESYATPPKKNDDSIPVIGVGPGMIVEILDQQTGVTYKTLRFISEVAFDGKNRKKARAHDVSDDNGNSIEEWYDLAGHGIGSNKTETGSTTRSTRYKPKLIDIQEVYPTD